MARFSDQLQRLRQRKELLAMLIIFFVIVIFWIILGVFSSQQRSGITADQRELAQPLNPAIDASVIERLELKRLYTEAELNNFPVFVVTDSQGETVLIDARETAASPANITFPPDLELELQQLEGEN